MKLELKHIAPYLPYNPKVLNGYGEISDLKTEFIRYPKLFINHNEIENIALILRPLSDLTKQISNGVGLFYPYEELNLCYSDVTNFLNEDLWIGQWWDYEKVSKLIEWHFDIFGLIDKGIAIDINTINQ